MTRRKELNDLGAKYGADMKKEYEQKGKSIYALADEYGTYPQKIHRILKSMGTKMRDKSECQKEALKSGRKIHPSIGRILTQEHKDNIGKTMSDRYYSLSDDEKEKKRLEAKARFDKLTDEQRGEMKRKGTEGVLKAARDGSKLELFLLDKLNENGYNVVFHKKGFIINDKLEIDLLLPNQKIAIEVDGVFHVKDVWENGKLLSVQSKDSEKNGLLLSNGYVIIRLGNVEKSCTNAHYTKKWKKLEEVILEVRNKFPELNNRLIYIE